MEVLKISAKTDPKKAAGALAEVLESTEKQNYRLLGPVAVNQATKAIAIARGFLAPNGIDIVCIQDLPM